MQWLAYVLHLPILSFGLMFRCFARRPPPPVRPSAVRPLEPHGPNGPMTRIFLPNSLMPVTYLWCMAFEIPLGIVSAALEVRLASLNFILVSGIFFM